MHRGPESDVVQSLTLPKKNSQMTPLMKQTYKKVEVALPVWLAFSGLPRKAPVAKRLNATSDVIYFLEYLPFSVTAIK